MIYNDIRLDIAEGVATLTLSRPEQRNSMTTRMGDEVQAACEVVAARENIRAMIVTGAGRAFCAGGNFDFIEKMIDLGETERQEEMLAFYARYLAVIDVPIPTIAVINGPAIGAGMCFASACDIRLARAGTKLGFTFVKLGLHPGMGATWLLPRLVGVSRAADLLFTGRIITAEQACEMGLVNEVLPAEALMPRAQEIVEALRTSGPLAVRQVKRSLYDGLGGTLEAALKREAQAQAIDYGTPELAEGVRAAREKRAPEFSSLARPRKD